MPDPCTFVDVSVYRRRTPKMCQQTSTCHCQQSKETCSGLAQLPASVGTLRSLLNAAGRINVWCRGYKGRIKNVTDREVRVELEAQARTVTVRRDQIPPEDGGAPVPRPAPVFGMGSATPAHAGMRTPAYPSATPMHPSMTPSHPGESSEAWGWRLARAPCTRYTYLINNL